MLVHFACYLGAFLLIWALTKGLETGLATLIGHMTTGRRYQRVELTMLQFIPVMRDNILMLAAMLLLKALAKDLDLPRFAHTFDALAWALVLTFLIEILVRFTARSGSRQPWQRRSWMILKFAYLCLSGLWGWNMALS